VKGGGVVVRAEATVLIDRSVEEVWEYASSVENAPEWMSGVVEFEKASAGPEGVGMRCRGVSLYLGRPTSWTSRVTRWEPGRGWEVEAVVGGIRVREVYSLEPIEGGTRVNQLVEYELSGILRLAQPLFGLMAKRSAEGNLANLGQVLRAEQG
jgi:uncharacterized membrane protein